ncbi:MAG: hypothetical protein QXR45_10500 [Candidatus Bathyarchaeia archaeon]
MSGGSSVRTAATVEANLAKDFPEGERDSFRELHDSEVSAERG